MVRWRLRRVSDECAEVLEIASVIGERFDAALVASAAARDEAATVDLLDEAARAGLIAEVDDEPDCWRFSHPLSQAGHRRPAEQGPPGPAAPADR